SLAATRGAGVDSPLPADVVAPGVHPVPLRPPLLALHVRGGGAFWRGAGRMARRAAHPAVPPAAPRRLRSGAIMEKRIILAIFLMLIVAVLPSILFPTKKPVSRTGGAVGDTGAGSPPAAPAAESLSARPPVRPSGPVSAPAETVWVTSPTYRLGFSTRGASLVSAELLGNRSFAAADSGRPVQLVPVGRPWLRYALTAGGDTAALADWIFTPGAARVHVGEGRDTALLSFTAERGGARIALEYHFYAAEYRFAAQGRLAGFGSGGATLRVGMGGGPRS